MSTHTLCSTCGAEILWRLTPKGKAIPLDAEQVLGGNILLDGDAAVSFLTHIEVLEMRESGDLTYQSHFVSCPQAGVHRTRRRGSRGGKKDG